jgi:hypothetical protein
MSDPVIFARIPKNVVKLLKNVSKNRGEDVSDFVRRSVYKELASLSFLSDEQKKALGVVRQTNKNEKGVCK